MGEDHRASDRRTTVAEAAQILGISAEAVRGRIRRGTLPVEREGGAVYVLLETPGEDRTTADQPRTTASQPPDRTDELIATLREQLEEEREANRENRRIIAALTSRIPELPPASGASSTSEPRESPSEATPQPGRVGPQTPLRTGAQESRESPHEMHMPEVGGGPLPHDQQRTSERPWWRRVFGG